ADVPEPSADARVRGSRRADEADADDALRDGRAQGHADAVRRRGSSEAGLRSRRCSPPEDRSVMAANESPAQLIDAKIEELGDWRGETLARLRALIKQAEPEVVEEWKWRKATNPGVPVWSHHGGICTGESYNSRVKLTVLHGAALDDRDGLCQL